MIGAASGPEPARGPSWWRRWRSRRERLVRAPPAAESRQATTRRPLSLAPFITSPAEQVAADALHWSLAAWGLLGVGLFGAGYALFERPNQPLLAINLKGASTDGGELESSFGSSRQAVARTPQRKEPHPGRNLIRSGLAAGQIGRAGGRKLLIKRRKICPPPTRGDSWRDNSLTLKRHFRPSQPSGGGQFRAQLLEGRY